MEEQSNSVASLDLYAQAETMLENSEATQRLHGYYLELLKQLDFDSLVDIGCGSGEFLSRLKKDFNPSAMLGIDLSPQMIKMATQRGVEAEVIDLCDLTKRFDIATAMFDMVNYLSKEQIGPFLNCLSERLEDGGYFLFDINSEFGFEEVAVGSYIVEEKSRFLAIDSDYQEGRYEAAFTLFTQEESCYKKTSEQLVQYLHEVEYFENLADFELVVCEPISLYELEEPDKYLIILKKR